MDTQDGIAELSILEIASARWLNVPEIIALLSPETTPLCISPDPPFNPPPSGTLLLYDRSVTRNYKADGYDWIRKRNSPKVREDHVKLRVDGKYKVAGCYVHCATVLTLHRRAYHLLGDSDEQNQNESVMERGNQVKKGSLILLHYLDTGEASAVSARLTDGLAAAANKSAKKGKRGARNSSSSEIMSTSSFDRPSVSGDAEDGHYGQQYVAEYADPTQLRDACAPDHHFSSAVHNSQPEYAYGYQQQQHDPSRATARGSRQMNSSSFGGRERHRPVDSASSFDYDSIMPKNHRPSDSAVSFDPDTLDLFWSMVMDDHATGKHEDKTGITEQLQEAAASAIEKHLTPVMEENLANNLEQALTEAAASAVMENSELSRYESDDVAMELEEEVVSRLDSHIPPGLEAKLVRTIERQLFGDSNSSPGSGDVISSLSAPRGESEHDVLHRHFQEGKPYYESNKYDAHRRQTVPTQSKGQHGSQEAKYRRSRNDDTYQVYGNLDQVDRHDQETQSQQQDLQENSKRVADGCRVYDAPSVETSVRGGNDAYQGRETSIPSRRAPAIPQAMPAPPTPLPDIVDFTPPEIELGRVKIPQVVISMSNSLRSLPPDSKEWKWQALAGFVDVLPVSGASSSTEICSTDALVRSVALSPIYKVTPFSYKCDLPSNAIECPGCRSIILVGVKTANSVAPVKYEAAMPAVIDYLQAEWSSALNRRSSHGVQNSAIFLGQLALPTFTTSSGGATVLFLSQLSRDFFEFLPAYERSSRSSSIITPVTDNRIVEGGKFLEHMLSAANEARSCSGAREYASDNTNDVNCSKSVSSVKSSNSFDYPAPAPAMAMIASALLRFPDPPTEAVVQQESSVFGNLFDGSSSAEPSASSRLRKRPASMSIDETGSDAESCLKLSASNWMATPAQRSSSTVGDTVNRHCKIRFVERLTNVMKDRDGDRNIDTMGVRRKMSDDGTGSATTTASGDVLWSDDQLRQMDNEEIDALLDNALIRFVECLVEMSSNPEQLKTELNAPGFSGFTLLHFASLYNFKALMPLLISRGANPDVRTVRGELTPLHLACGAGNVWIVKYLARSGGSIDARDSFGLSAVDHARRNGFTEVAQWLIVKRAGQEPSDLDCGGPTSTAKNDFPRQNSPEITMFYSEDDSRDLMRSAFSKLSLKDKLGLNLIVQKQQQGISDSLLSATVPEEMMAMREPSDGVNVELANSTHRRNIPGDELGEIDGTDINQVNKKGGQAKLDDCPFISETDHENLNVAMSLMNQEELTDLKNTAVESDVRGWMLRSNYESLRDAALQLQSQREKSASVRGEESFKELGEAANNISQNENSTNGVTGAPRSLNNVKLSQALAMLVIRKNLLASKADGESSPPR